ncbi:unnamed protein product [Brassicogethes aeneus]|uniref:EndoU domain-containing protein n=1 Tax=Brassicogethes aeneus TaxID=1431903 RepID=A0A9P0AZA0_BRAAE|nr:unnamed protein product [Brassicogethes aeneus]
MENKAYTSEKGTELKKVESNGTQKDPQDTIEDGPSTSKPIVCTPEVCRQARQRFQPPDLADSPFLSKLSKILGIDSNQGQNAWGKISGNISLAQIGITSKSTTPWPELGQWKKKPVQNSQNNQNTQNTQNNNRNTQNIAAQNQNFKPVSFQDPFIRNEQNYDQTRNTNPKNTLNRQDTFVIREQNNGNMKKQDIIIDTHKNTQSMFQMSTTKSLARKDTFVVTPKPILRQETFVVNPNYTSAWHKCNPFVNTLSSSTQKPKVVVPTTNFGNNEYIEPSSMSEDDELREFSETLLKKDVNNAAKYVQINLQMKTTSRSTVDEAPLPLLTINSKAYNIPSIAKLMPLYNNYILETNVNEVYTAQEKNEENDLLDVILQTPVMQYTRNFLIKKGTLGKDPKEFKTLLKQIWFNMYSRGGGKIGSSGFEHIFLGELKNNSLSGLHNWLYFNEEESMNRANYLGYMKKLDLGDKGSIIKHHFTFHNVDKPVDSMFIGTSPEFEMALYSTCFVLRADRICPLKLNNNSGDFSAKLEEKVLRDKKLSPTAFDFFFLYTELLKKLPALLRSQLTREIGLLGKPRAKFGCKKVGLFYSLACTNCQGRSCSNVESPTVEDSFNSNEVTCDTSLLTQFTCTQDEDEEQEEEQEEEEQEEEEQEEDQEEFKCIDSNQRQNAWGKISGNISLAQIGITSKSTTPWPELGQWKKKPVQNSQNNQNTQNTQNNNRNTQNIAAQNQNFKPVSFQDPFIRNEQNYDQIRNTNPKNTLNRQDTFVIREQNNGNMKKQDIIIDTHKNTQSMFQMSTTKSLARKDTFVVTPKPILRQETFVVNPNYTSAWHKGNPFGNTLSSSTQKPKVVVPTTNIGNNDYIEPSGMSEDDELREFSETLLKKDVNNAAKYVQINLQMKTTSRSTVDEAPLPLLTINSKAYNIPSIAKLIPLYNNYILKANVNEVYTAQEKNEETDLLDVILQTPVMQYTRNFLIKKGILGKDPKEFKTLLKQIWFNMYSRGDGKIGSSGFEHIFLGELKKSKVSGLHNWLYFNEEESMNRANYLGYMKILDLGDKGSIIKHHFTFHNVDKPVDSMFIGTSPEFEMALYSTCFVLRANRICPLKLNNNSSEEEILAICIVAGGQGSLAIDPTGNLCNPSPWIRLADSATPACGPVEYYTLLNVLRQVYLMVKSLNSNLSPIVETNNKSCKLISWCGLAVSVKKNCFVSYKW